MLLTRLLPPARVRAFLADETGSANRVWFALSILYAVVCATLALRQAFAGEYVLADDVRQHVFWMFRFIDPKFFPNDPIADYFNRSRRQVSPPSIVSLLRLELTRCSQAS